MGTHGGRHSGPYRFPRRPAASESQRAAETVRLSQRGPLEGPEGGPRGSQECPFLAKQTTRMPRWPRGRGSTEDSTRSLMSGTLPGKGENYTTEPDEIPNRTGF